MAYQVNGDSPEVVALQLLEMVANVERRAFRTHNLNQGEQAADRAYILDTYAECLVAVQSPGVRSP